jgi:hypothetical protein
MSNSISAEPMAGTECDDPTNDDKSLTHHTKTSGSLAQPHLRIVHSADRLQDPSSIEMPPPDRPRLPPDRPSAKLATLDRPPMLDRSVQVQIGRMLREHFSGVAGESVPERFITLLAELEAKEKSR